MCRDAAILLAHEPRSLARRAIEDHQVALRALRDRRPADFVEGAR